MPARSRLAGTFHPLPVIRVPSLEIRRQPQQTQTLSPRLQHAVRLLQMSSLDFAALLRETLSRNPFLEIEDGEDAPAPEAGTGPPGDGAAAPPEAGADAESEPEGGGDRELWQAEMGTGSRRADAGEVSALDLMAVETSLSAHLQAQINVLPLTPRDLALAHVLIGSLDEDGYLRTPLAELVDMPGLDPAPSLPELQIALRRVQALDPAGIGARSVRECLLLQMPSIDCPALRELATRIVERHLPALAARDVNGLARQLNETPARIEAVCDRIRHLEPRPGWRLGSSAVAYITPDVVVKKRRGLWQVRLNPAIVPKVRLNQVYATLFQRHRGPQDGELGAHLQEARWTLRNVEQRFSTILDVAEAIVRRQHSFLEYGAMAMKPLGLKEIADEVGIHPSTVSRVTNNKYMATPVGVFELKYFFSRAMTSASGHACSGTAIRGLIKDIIAAESAEQPLSDAEIARQLAQQGLVMARRTVTKYRQMLKIEALERRRRHA